MKVCPYVRYICHLIPLHQGITKISVFPLTLLIMDVPGIIFLWHAFHESNDWKDIKTVAV